MDKKLLRAELAARAEQKEKDRLEVKTFSVGGVDMLFHKPAQADQLDYVEAINEASGARDSVAVSVSLIYDCCRDLQGPSAARGARRDRPLRHGASPDGCREIDKLGAALARWIGLLPDSGEDKAAPSGWRPSRESIERDPLLTLRRFTRRAASRPRRSGA